MSGAEQKALRADARENRQRIVRVAHEMLAVSSDASLNSIAKAAGVGPGTLYRHFPNREALVLAVYRAGVEAGVIRPGLEADDILLLMGALWRVPPGEVGEAQTQRLQDLAIEGIRSR